MTRGEEFGVDPGRLPSFMSGSSRVLPSGVRTNWMRSGLVLAIVGGHLASSVITRSWASVTGASLDVLAVRAAVNSSSQVASSIATGAEIAIPPTGEAQRRPHASSLR